MPGHSATSNAGPLPDSPSRVPPEQFGRLLILADRAALSRDLGRGVGHLLANVLQVAAVALGLPPESADQDGTSSRWLEERLTVARQVLGRLGQLDEAVAPSPLPLTDLLREVELCDSVRPGAGQVPLRVHAEPGLPAVALAPGPLLQAILALVANARDATLPAAGAEVRLDARPGEDGVVIQVHDSGPGLPPDLRERAFQPFFTTKAPERHQGLGLTAARLIVERAGGSVWLESGEGARGTVACVRLPGWRASRKGADDTDRA